MPVLPSLDVAVLLAYLAGVVVMGCWFARRSRTPRGFMVAGGAIPGWAVGLSIFGTYLSSNTFLGVPGKAYATNWNAFVFSLSLPVAALLALKFFVPFYRRSGEISAYHHLEQRFGPWARTYAVACYLLTQIARVGAIMFGVALGLQALTGWELAPIILTAGFLVTLYTLIGGIEAVIWTDVVQSLVLVAGALLIAAVLIFGNPLGPGEAFRIAADHSKFSLGDPAFDFTSSTIWVVLLYGLFINLNNLGIDQSYVQRYHAASSTRAAARAVLTGSLLYVPVSLLFFLIGSLLFSYYSARPELLADLGAANPGDQVLPHFIATVLPPGVGGLLIAALCAAAMSSIDTSLNSSATITLTDIYERYVRPGADERSRLRVLRLATVGWGACGTTVALAMIGVHSILDAWWQLSGIFAGGMLGLFLLGIISRRARNPEAVAGVVAGVLAIFWVTSSPGSFLPRYMHSPFHAHMAIVVGTLTIFLVGCGASAARAWSARPGSGSRPSG